LAHTRDDARALNDKAREALKASGELGLEKDFETSRGTRAFGAGDRLLFLRNERQLGVKNGTLGTVEAIQGASLVVRADDGREVRVDTGAYADFDHGYAVTVHKAQGVTVDHAHVLATPGFDRHLAYVACTRHRLGLTVVYDQTRFPNKHALYQTLFRERSKDVTLDYMDAFAEARDFERDPPKGGREASRDALLKHVETLSKPREKSTQPELGDKGLSQKGRPISDPKLER
jgi:hypothetical protein